MDVDSRLGKIHSTNVRLIFFITPLIFICGIAALIFSYFSYRTMYAAQEANENRHQSYLLVEQLRLSSDQLTLMARSYAVTGNEKYLHFYKDILAIRNGTKPRPVLSLRIYWHLLMPESGKAPFIDDQEKTFKQLLSELDFTPSELALLAKAQEGSNQLTELEFKAFDAVQKGLEKSADYQHSEQRLFALSLLYSNDYFIEKAKTMSFINEFLELYELRSNERIESVHQQLYWLTRLAFFLFILLVLLLVYSLYIRTYDKELFVKTLRKEVEDRTQQLSEKCEELKEVINEMKATKNQLIESEKMASLGSLVSGVAHEVNTPLGVSVTLASHMQDETKQLSKNLEAGLLKRSDLENYCAESSESYQMLSSNLQRAANLIRSFKQVAVDQSCEELRSFKISEYLQEVLLSLHHMLKKTQIQVKVEAPENEIEVQTYPGALAQIITNLVMNAFIHAFNNGQESGQILLSIEYEQDNVKLKVEDNGKGMEQDVRDKIFELFFTTKRGSGGSGLGMNIVYNLVVHRLLGTISCQSSVGKGSTFLLRFPTRIEYASDRSRG